jgi:hypothetical protein
MITAAVEQAILGGHILAVLATSTSTPFSYDYDCNLVSSDPGALFL